MTMSTSVNLTDLIKAAVDFHRVFCSDRVRQHLAPGYVDQLEVFVGEVRMVRWGLLTTSTKIAEVWNLIIPSGVEPDEGEIRPASTIVNEAIVDYVLNGSAYVRLMVDIPSAHWESFVSDLSHRLCWPHRATLIDGELKERAAEPSFVRKAFEDSDWMLFLYLLSVAPLEFSADPLVFDDTSSSGDKD